MKRAWRLLKALSTKVWRAAAGSVPHRAIKEHKAEITLPNGAEIWLRTAEKPESLAGEAVDGAVLDEFTLMLEKVWSEYLRATLLDFKGWVLMIGVPKGRNWAAGEFRKALNREGWRRFQFTTYDNPFLDAADIDKIKADTAELLFQQEYLAAILDDAGTVFRSVVDAAVSMPGEPISGRQYVLGVDWGKKLDFTSISVFDALEKREVDLDRFNQIDYKIQTNRLKAMWERWNRGTIVAEANAMGEPLIEELRAQGMPVVAFTTTNATKTVAVEALQLAFERGDIQIINDPVSVGELQAFEGNRLPSGLMRYSAPEGEHDDTVISKMLAWQGIASNQTGAGKVEVQRGVAAGGDW
jgi:hypothetical protein